MLPQEAHHRAVVDNGRSRNPQPMRFVPASSQPSKNRPPPGYVAAKNIPQPNQQLQGQPPGATRYKIYSPIVQQTGQPAPAQQPRPRPTSIVNHFPLWQYQQNVATKVAKGRFNREYYNQQRQQGAQPAMPRVDTNNVLVKDSSGNLLDSSVFKKNNKGQDDEGVLIEEGEMPSNDASTSHSSFDDGPLDEPNPRKGNLDEERSKAYIEPGALAVNEHAPFYDRYGRLRKIKPIRYSHPCPYEETKLYIQRRKYRETCERLWWVHVDSEDVQRRRLVCNYEAQELANRLGLSIRDNEMDNFDWAPAEEKTGSISGPFTHGTWRRFENSKVEDDRPPTLDHYPSQTKEAPKKPEGSQKRKIRYSSPDVQGKRRKLVPPAPTRPTDATAQYVPRRAPQNTAPPAPVVMLGRPNNGQAPSYVRQPVNSFCNAPPPEESSDVSSRVVSVPRGAPRNPTVPKTPAVPELRQARNTRPIPVDGPPANQDQQATRPQYSAGRVIHLSTLNMIRGGEQQRMQSGYWSPGNGVYPRVPANSTTRLVPGSDKSIAIVEDADMEDHNTGLLEYVTNGVEDDHQKSDVDDEPSGGEYGDSDYYASEANSIISSPELERMSEKQQMDYFLNRTIADHERIVGGVTNGKSAAATVDANGIERGTAGQQPLALSPIIRLSLDPDHSTPVIPPLQEPLSEESHDDDEMEEADGGLNIFEQDDIMVEEELAKSLEDTTVSSAVQKEARSLDGYSEEEKIVLGIAESLKDVKGPADPAPPALAPKISEHSIPVVPSLQKPPSEVLPQPVPFVDGVPCAVDLSSIVHIALNVNESNIGDYSANAQQLFRVMQTFPHQTLLEIVKKGISESKTLTTGGSTDKVATEQQIPAESALHVPRDPVAQPASNIQLHSMMQRQIYSSRSSSEENDDTEGSSLGGNSTSTSPALDLAMYLGEESSTVQKGDGGEKAEPSIICTSGIDDETPTIADEAADIKMKELIDSTEHPVAEESIDEEKMEEDGDEKDGVEEKDNNKDETIDLAEDLVYEESRSIAHLAAQPAFDKKEMREDADNQIEDGVEEKNVGNKNETIDSAEDPSEEQSISTPVSQSSLDENVMEEVGEERDSEDDKDINNEEEPIEPTEDTVEEESIAITNRKSLPLIDEEDMEEDGDEKDGEEETDHIENEDEPIETMEDLIDEQFIANPADLPSFDEEEMEGGEEEEDNINNEEVNRDDSEEDEEKIVVKKKRGRQGLSEEAKIYRREREAMRAEEAKAKKCGIGSRVSKAMDVKEREVAKPVSAKPTRGRGRPRKTAVQEEESEMPSTSNDSVSDENDSQQQNEEAPKGRSQLRTMGQLSQDEDPQLYLLLVKEERQKTTSAHRRKSGQVTDSKRNAFKMLEQKYKQKPQDDSNTKTYTMSTVDQIEQQVDISILPLDSDGNLVGQPLAESDSTVPTTTPIVNADEAESNSEIERDDGTRPPEGFSIIAPRRENTVEVAGSNFEDLFETNTAPILPPPHPPLQPRTEYATTPIILVKTKEEANSEKLRRCIEKIPICMLRGVIEAVRIDLEIFSAESLHKNHPEQYVELRTQLKFDVETCLTRRGKETWEYSSYRVDAEEEDLAGFMKMYQESIQTAVEAVLGSGKRTMDGKDIKFGTNIDMTRDKAEFMPEFWELDKLPAFCGMSSDRDLLGVLEHIVLGVNTPQAYIKVPGNRTPAHLENNNLTSVNINIGPGTCTWYGCEFKYWGYINEELKKRGMHFQRDSWWPDSDFLLSIGVPVNKFTQYPGDIVMVGPGSPHWVQADGWCSNIAWNVCPSTHVQLTVAIHQYEWNVRQKYGSLLPIQYFFWILAMKNNITDPKVFALVKATLSRSLANCYTMVDYVQKKLGRKLKPVKRDEDQKEPIAHRSCHWERKFKGEAAYFSCEVECFNILFVKKEKEVQEEEEEEEKKKSSPVANSKGKNASSQTTKIKAGGNRGKKAKRKTTGKIKRVEEHIEQEEVNTYCANCIWKAGKGFDDYETLLEIPLETLQRIFDNMKLKTAEPDSASSSSSLPRLPMGKKKATPKKKTM